MSRAVLAIVGLAVSVSAATAATGSFLETAPPPAPTAQVVSAAEEPISLNGALVAAAVLVAGFLSVRRRAD